MVDLEALFRAVADTFDGDLAIEKAAHDALLAAAPEARAKLSPADLPPSLRHVMAAEDAHPACTLIAATPLPWAPPETSDDPTYVEASRLKAHVELLGPGGLVQSQHLRLGLYGMQPGADYGIRTHPAEEVFVMLAGEGLWKKGDGDYEALGPGARAHHPSLTPHATRTASTAFLSVYVWAGDISTEGYVYFGQSSD